MQEENICFEEIGKEETAHAEQSSAQFKQPICGRYPNLHAELKAKCAPEKFMNPYEPEKVSKANDLYADILATDTQANEKLQLLRLRAIEELGVKFSTEQLYEKLIAACNPKNFTGTSYDKERLELANGLYQQILMNADNIFALEEIEKEAKELIVAYRPRQHESGAPSNNNNLVDNILWMALIVFIFGIIIIGAHILTNSN